MKKEKETEEDVNWTDEDWGDFLGLDENATPEEIEKAFENQLC